MPAQCNLEDILIDELSACHSMVLYFTPVALPILDAYADRAIATGEILASGASRFL